MKKADANTLIKMAGAAAAVTVLLAYKVKEILDKQNFSEE